MVITAIFIVVMSLIGVLVVSNLADDRMDKEALEKGYVQRLENGRVLWVKETTPESK